MSERTLLCRRSKRGKVNPDMREGLNKNNFRGNDKNEKKIKREYKSSQNMYIYVLVSILQH